MIAFYTNKKSLKHLLLINSIICCTHNHEGHVTPGISSQWNMQGLWNDQAVSQAFLFIILTQVLEWLEICPNSSCNCKCTQPTALTHTTHFCVKLCGHYTAPYFYAIYSPTAMHVTYIICNSIKVLSPTDAQENCFKRSIKIYIKTAPTCFGVITIIREHTIWAC